MRSDTENPWLNKDSLLLAHKALNFVFTFSKVEESPSINEQGSCFSSTTSAKNIPYAERIEEYLWANTSLIPSDSATATACWPPAPPKVTSL